MHQSIEASLDFLWFSLVAEFLCVTTLWDILINFWLVEWHAQFWSHAWFWLTCVGLKLVQKGPLRGMRKRGEIAHRLPSPMTPFTFGGPGTRHGSTWCGTDPQSWHDSLGGAPRTRTPSHKGGPQLVRCVSKPCTNPHTHIDMGLRVQEVDCGHI